MQITFGLQTTFTALGWWKNDYSMSQFTKSILTTYIHNISCTPNSFHDLVNTFHISWLKVWNPNFFSTEYPVFIHPRMLWKERMECCTHFMAIVLGSVKTWGLILKLRSKRQNPKLPWVCIRKHTLCPLSKVT